MNARAEQRRDACHEAALARLGRTLKPKASTARPRLAAVLSPFLWLGGRVVFRLSAIVKRRHRKRRAKEKQRRRGERALQLRRLEIRTEKQEAKTAHLARQCRADRQSPAPARSARRSTPEPPNPEVQP